MALTHSGTAVLAAFLASLVEAVEALTIVLAVGTVRGWRPALLGAGAGAAALAVIVIAFNPVLRMVPLGWLQLAVGILLLLFGARWLRKAVLRAVGLIALHDEAAAFAKETSQLRTAAVDARRRWDALAIVTSCKAVVIEGLEVIFIVIAFGATSGLLVPAGIGAAAACLVVIALGVAIHRPLARVPENTLKFAVGVMLSAFGVFWIGEGIGLAWPGEDLSIVALILAFLAVGVSAVPLTRQRVAAKGVS